MAFKKSHLFPTEDQVISAYGQAISHPVRVEILRTLKKMPGCTVDFLARDMPLSRPTVSGHLRILRKAHLVIFKEKFPHTHYWVDKREMDSLKEKLTVFLSTL